MSAEACLLAPGPKRTDDLTAQWKRRTTLTTEVVFPHLRSRLEVVSSEDTDLSPLDAAIDAIQVGCVGPFRRATLKGLLLSRHTSAHNPSHSVV